MSGLRGEQKYQLLKLIHSGINLSEANFLMRVVYVASFREYLTEKDYKKLLMILDKLENFGGLLETRKQRKKKVIQNYTRSAGQTRIANLFGQNNAIANKTLNSKIDFKRIGLLRRRVLPYRQPPRPGSSLGKIGQTKVIGANKVNKDINKLATSLNKMIKSWESIGQGTKGRQKARAEIDNFIQNIRTSVNIKRT